MNTLPQIPIAVAIAIPVIFLILILFTDYRYSYKPQVYLHHGTTIAGLAIGFVFLYTLGKYDGMNTNIPTVVRNITYLSNLASIHDPSLNCYLVEYLNNFINFNNTLEPLLIFEDRLLRLIKNENEILRIREAVTTLEAIFSQRVSGTNLIAEPIWYAVFIVGILLSIIFPLDASFEKRIDAVITLFIIWLPIITVYYLYIVAYNNLYTQINALISTVKTEIKKDGVTCDINQISSQSDIDQITSRSDIDRDIDRDIDTSKSNTSKSNTSSQSQRDRDIDTSSQRDRDIDTSSQSYRTDASSQSYRTDASSISYSK